MSCNCNQPKGFNQPHVGHMGTPSAPSHEGAPMMPYQGQEHMMYGGGHPANPYDAQMMQHPMGMAPGMGAHPGFMPMQPGMGYPMMGYSQQPQPFPHQAQMGHGGFMQPQPHMGQGQMPSEHFMGHGGQPGFAGQPGQPGFMGQPGMPGHFGHQGTPQAPFQGPGAQSTGIMPPTGYMPDDDDFE